MIDPYEIFVRAIDVHRRLLAAGIDNAIGGALALGYHIDDPRAPRTSTSTSHCPPLGRARR